MNQYTELSSAQLKQALRIKEQIENLERELADILGTVAPRTAAPGRRTRGRGRRAGAGASVVSQAPATPGRKRRGRRKLTPAEKRKLSLQAKRRWAEAKAAGRSRL